MACSRPPVMLLGFTTEGDAAGVHDGAPAEGRDRIASDGSVTDAYDPSDDEGPDDDDDSGNAASAADRRREDQRRLVYAAAMSR